MLLVLTLVFALLPTVSAEAEDPAPVILEQTVTLGDIQVDILRYTPEDFNFRGGITPLILVFGDQPFTKESAAETLVSKGFLDIAAEESCSILFLSPRNGESWTEEDYPDVRVVCGNVNDAYFNYEAPYTSGIDADGRFYSSHTREYYFAEGSAVDFVKTCMDNGTAYYDVSKYSNGKIDNFGSGFSYAEEGFTKEQVLADWAKLKHTLLMYSNGGVTFYAPFYEWSELGVTETREVLETPYEDIPELEYYLYVPEGVGDKDSGEKVPLVLIFHGSAQHPQTMAQTTGWPMVAKQEGFLVAAVNGLYSTTNNAGAITLLIDKLAEEYAIDTTRVYCSGYSKGAAVSVQLGAALPDKIAGIALYEPVYSYGTNWNCEPTAVLPYYAVLGTLDFYRIFPQYTSNAVTAFQQLGAANGFTYDYDESIGGLWGYRFDLDESIRLPEERATMNIHSIISDDGNVYTKLVDAYNLGHNILRASAPDMWDFLSQFSRNPDTTLEVNRHHTFADVAEDAWFFYPVQAAVKNGLFVGTSDDTFSPAAKASRAMMVTVLYRMAGSPEITEAAGFTDVPEDAWFADAVAWAKQNGIVYGVSDTSFAPGREITRQDTITILYRYAAMLEAAAEGQQNLDEFADADQVAPYAADAMAWAVANRIVMGSISDGKTLLTPKASTPRAQLATLLLRFGTLVGQQGIS